jgi:hypothetical protein
LPTVSQVDITFDELIIGVWKWLSVQVVVRP